MEPYLGDMIGKPIEPHRDVYHSEYRPADWVERAIWCFVNCLAIALLTGGIGLWIFLTAEFMRIRPAMGAAWSLPISCEQVRALARGMTVSDAIRRARDYGLTEAEIAQIESCLKEKRK